MANRFLQKLEKRIVRLSDQEYKPRLLSLQAFLGLISRLYQIGVEIRLKLYELGIFKKKRLDCFVVSIGNIMAGGTGKTPMAIYLAELFRKLGKTPVVISRGYKGKIKTGCALVGDGDSLFLDAETAGDEPYMMAARRSFPVMVGRDRHEAGAAALERLKPDVIILDDGFQHTRLHRDLDILLFDYDRPLGNGKLLPAGRLRETLKMAQSRAHAVLFTRCPEHEKTAVPIRTQAGMEKIIQGLGTIHFFKTRHVPFLVKWITGEGQEISKDLESLQGKKALLFSGIADNRSFRFTVETMGCTVLDHLEFTDHYRYKEPDILMIKEKMGQIDADILITTEKDWIKLDPGLDWQATLAVIGVTIRFKDEQGFQDFIRSRLGR